MVRCYQAVWQGDFDLGEAMLVNRVAFLAAKLYVSGFLLTTRT
jgi:hypothetical protein